jgi:phosphoribosyl 1,2-cyclic phosphate phosphodiesterase
MKITFLGTGTSHGVPQIDCILKNYEHCPQNVCRLGVEDPRHIRTRSSLLVSFNDKNILIDAGPDLRQQCLRENVTSIDAVLTTHCHADHIFGIPDIRSYSRDHVIPFYGSRESIQAIRASFPYIFDPDTPEGGGIPRITTSIVDSSFPLFGSTVTPVKINHLSLCGCYGYRIGPMAYIPDIKTISEQECEKLEGLSLLVLNCLRRSPEHVSHLTITESVALARRIAPERCFFVHMSHDIHYRNDRSYLDPRMDFAWDGLSIDLP